MHARVLRGVRHYLPAAGIEYYYYDQLGSGLQRSTRRRRSLGSGPFRRRGGAGSPGTRPGRHNFFLLGHSWGGILAIEYALRHQQHLKGLVISNMMASFHAYNAYAERADAPWTRRRLPRSRASRERQGPNPRYMELLMEHHYVHHVLRLPPGSGPIQSSGPLNTSTQRSTSRCRAPASSAQRRGQLAQWDRTADLA